MKESEALTKRCIGPEYCGEKRKEGMFAAARYCIASGCMAWKWKYKSKRILYEEGDSFEDMRKEDWLGYCAFGTDKEIYRPSEFRPPV